MATPQARVAGADSPVADGPVADGPVADGPRQALPAALRAGLAEFCRHLDAERALSRHTIRAYHGDIQSLFEYARGQGIYQPGRRRRRAPGGSVSGNAPPPRDRRSRPEQLTLFD